MGRPRTIFEVYDRGNPTGCRMLTNEICAVFGIEKRNLNKYSEYGDRRARGRYTFIPVASATREEAEKDEREYAREWAEKAPGVDTLRDYVIIYSQGSSIGQTVIRAAGVRQAAMSFSDSYPQYTLMAVQAPTDDTAGNRWEKAAAVS